ncbi:MAG: plasmid maintenance system antidote protein [Prevotellaceae bacterium]|jgi:addiction module HigA family antidote|nr:plasmid maintenance system antidote protein [Prevotellaceae bacterium]
MLPEINKIKGVHPGVILKRELLLKGIESKQFALSINEHPQTINAITKERRGINPTLSIKLGYALSVDEEYFMLLQTYYEIKIAHKELLTQQKKPDLNNIRQILFWDTDINTIDWQKQRKAIIRRIFERGNDIEIKEIISFYGKDIIIEELQSIPSYMPTLAENAMKYLNLNLNTEYAV